MEEIYELLSRKTSFNFTLIIRGLLFVLGLFILALGASFLINANIGAATWDVLHIGLANLTNLSVGSCVQVVGIIMILMTAFFERKAPTIGGMMNILLVGFFLNIILSFKLIPHFSNFLPRIMLLLIGIVLMGFGSGMYVSSKVGSGPRDGMTLFIANKFSISIRLSRTLLEISAVTIGWLIGGPVSLGTFVSVPLIGPVMQASLKFWTMQLNKLSSNS